MWDRICIPKRHAQRCCVDIPATSYQHKYFCREIKCLKQRNAFQSIQQ